MAARIVLLANCLLALDVPGRWLSLLLSRDRAWQRTGTLCTYMSSSQARSSPNGVCRFGHELTIPDGKQRRPVMQAGCGLLVHSGHLCAPMREPAALQHAQAMIRITGNLVTLAPLPDGGCIVHVSPNPSCPCNPRKGSSPPIRVRICGSRASTAVDSVGQSGVGITSRIQRDLEK